MTTENAIYDEQNTEHILFTLDGCSLNNSGKEVLWERISSLPDPPYFDPNAIMGCIVDDGKTATIFSIKASIMLGEKSFLHYPKHENSICIREPSIYTVVDGYQQKVFSVRRK